MLKIANNVLKNYLKNFLKLMNRIKMIAKSNLSEEY